MIDTNRTKARLARGEVCVAAMLPVAAPAIAELLAIAGSDAVIFEAEHGTLSEAQIEDMVRACEVAGATALCRAPGIDPAFFLRVLDAGVAGIVVPHIRSAADAAEVVASIKYPPLGKRGSGTSRASGYGAMNRAEYIATSNRETMAILMIEEPEAVDAIEEIVAVPGVDCLFIGRGDLSLTLGVGPSDPRLAAMVDRVVDAAKAVGMPYMVAAEEDEAPAWIARGAGMISLQAMGFLRRNWQRAVQQIRNDAAKR